MSASEAGECLLLVEFDVGFGLPVLTLTFSSVFVESSGPKRYA